MNRNTLLVVDDVEVNRAILRALFENNYNILEAENGEQALLLLNQYKDSIADKEIGIVLLTEKFGRDFPDLINRVRLEHNFPLFVEIPDRHGTGRKPDFITAYVNEAIGLKL